MQLLPPQATQFLEPQQSREKLLNSREKHMFIKDFGNRLLFY